MFVTADQLFAHAVGDYVLQSDWMATEKTKRTVAAAVHAATYVLPFLLITTSVRAIFVMFVTHFAIDRWRLARYVCWAKNFLSPVPPRTWAECSATGYPPDRPAWLVTWLLIIADNLMHVGINALSIKYL